MTSRRQRTGTQQPPHPRRRAAKLSTENTTAPALPQQLLLYDSPHAHATQSPDPATSLTVTVNGQQFTTSPVFDTYWRFAAARHDIYQARIAGQDPPWTSDPILQAHRFTNCFRAADRVSQYLIRHVIYTGPQGPDEIVFRTLLFKVFNKIDTWKLLTTQLGFPDLRHFDVHRYSEVLDDAFARGTRLYAAAYVMPSPPLGADRKHRNHLQLIAHMMDDNITGQLTNATTMAEAFRALRRHPGIGDFLAYQYLIDINYSTAIDFDEMDYVIAGPGARDGIRKCFGPASAGHEQQLIEYMTASQDEHFARLNLTFPGLFGRPLQLIDCQNLFCEVDKYARVRHPSIAGHSGRTRIEQKYRPQLSPTPAWFPPKWGLDTPDVAESAAIPEPTLFDD
ncbi:hypothetical protein JF729_07095 [Mycobacterium intracellulare]|uniref:nucleotide kinase domain-containing protein n=1 Tax=Mycobacterium intracellulare TaxID=1767 RepID=UPI001CD9DD94|nr:nucleotide kinase domain-containing protein [Mycobacterium intracellulare]MCA2247562.1 hypothetical protein [Mycobacterium intracellulare]